MKCVILAAGRGTRMGELTTQTPKPLLPIAGKTILDWKIEHLPDCIDSVVLVVNYLSEQFVDHMQTMHPHIKVEFAYQAESLGTYNAVYSARDYVKGEKFLVLGGDDLFHKAELSEMIADGCHIGVQKFVMPDWYDVCSIDENNMLVGFRKQTPTELIEGGYANTGCYILGDSFFELPIQLSEKGEQSLPHTLFQERAPDVRTYCMNKWVPINTQEELAYAQAVILGGLW
jgi:bifunctional UDP-N-acetylglucosamine pyrophosphorylase/glucosamine-1-phosphate N-acetyltransferase